MLGGRGAGVVLLGGPAVDDGAVVGFGVDDEDGGTGRVVRRGAVPVPLGDGLAPADVVVGADLRWTPVADACPDETLAPARTTVSDRCAGRASAGTPALVTLSNNSALPPTIRGRWRPHKRAGINAMIGR